MYISYIYFEINLSGCHRRCSVCSAFLRAAASRPTPPAESTTRPTRATNATPVFVFCGPV